MLVWCEYRSNTSIGRQYEINTERQKPPAARGRKRLAAINQTHIFVPEAFNTLNSINTYGQRFLDKLFERLPSVSGDSKETGFLYQIISQYSLKYSIW